VWEVVRAASTKPFGFMPFYPGPGLGGHCIPIDPFYLAWKARELNTPTRFIELAGDVNHAMPAYVVERVQLALNGHGKAVKGSSVLVLGLAYKPDVDDVRESPAFAIIERLRALEAEVRYHDPYVPRTWSMRRHDLGMSSEPLTASTVGEADVVVVCTAHTGVDYGLVAEHARLVVDTRDAMRDWAGELGDRLVRS
jgi:UDP-N-acetyl-D-glucosamine dehydrogenase